MPARRDVRDVARLAAPIVVVNQSPQKSAPRAVGVRAVGVKDARVAAAARKPAKPPQADTAPVPDVAVAAVSEP